MSEGRSPFSGHGGSTITQQLAKTLFLTSQKTLFRKLQEALGQKPLVGVICGILPGTDGTQRMSKSTGNTVNLDDPPNEMYGKVMSIPDSALLNFYTLVTRFGPDRIAAVARGLADGTLHAPAAAPQPPALPPGEIVESRQGRGVDVRDDKLGHIVDIRPAEPDQGLALGRDGEPTGGDIADAVGEQVLGAHQVGIRRGQPEGLRGRGLVGTERRGRLLLGAERGLGGGPDGHATVCELGHGGVGLDGRVGHVAVEIGVTCFDVRNRHPRAEVASPGQSFSGPLSTVLEKTATY